MYHFGLTVVLLLGTAGMARAQGPEFPMPGARLRVSVLSSAGPRSAQNVTSERLIGTLVEATDEELVLQVDQAGQVARIPRGAVTRVELSRGEKSRPGRGAALGLLIGGGGMAMVLGIEQSRYSRHEVFTPAQAAAVGFVVGGLPGVLLGVIVGSQVRTDDWDEVPLSGIRISALPAGGVGIRIEVPTPW